MDSLIVGEVCIMGPLSASHDHRALRERDLVKDQFYPLSSLRLEVIVRAF